MWIVIETRVRHGAGEVILCEPQPRLAPITSTEAGNRHDKEFSIDRFPFSDEDHKMNEKNQLIILLGVLAIVVCVVNIC